MTLNQWTTRLRQRWIAIRTRRRMVACLNRSLKTLEPWVEKSQIPEAEHRVAVVDEEVENGRAAIRSPADFQLYLETLSMTRAAAAFLNRCRLKDERQFPNLCECRSGTPEDTLPAEGNWPAAY